jgi:hypothetical protein
MAKHLFDSTAHKVFRICKVEGKCQVSDFSITVVMKVM